MSYIDLSHLLSKQMSIYPGDDLPEFKKTHHIELNGYRQTKLSFQSHVGTHIDAPAHIFGKGKYLNNLPISYFTGKAIVLTIPYGMHLITWDFLVDFEEEISESQFVLFNTGWGQYWGTHKYYQDFPVLDNNAAEYLTRFMLTGIGIDAPSADPVNAANLTNHEILLGEEILLIENLYFPEGFDIMHGEFYCFPLPYPDADGSPVRAVFKAE